MIFRKFSNSRIEKIPSYRFVKAKLRYRI